MLRALVAFVRRLFRRRRPPVAAPPPAPVRTVAHAAPRTPSVSGTAVLPEPPRILPEPPEAPSEPLDPLAAATLLDGLLTELEAATARVDGSDELDDAAATELAALAAEVEALAARLEAS